jgi:phage-related protein
LVTINLIAYDPFWYSDSQAVTIGSSTTATFPLVFPFVLPSNTATVVANNTGDIEAPVTIVITGDVTNPVLTNTTTGKAITFAKDMDAGDTMTITTGFGNKTVSYYDSSAGTTVNGFQYLSSSSEFWGLVPGENTLTFTATSIDAATRAIVTWQNRFSGV